MGSHGLHCLCVFCVVSNQFSTMRDDPTKVFQKEIRKVIDDCNILIHKEAKWQ